MNPAFTLQAAMKAAQPIVSSHKRIREGMRATLIAKLTTEKIQ